MKLAVISMTGKKPTDLPKSQTSFTQDDLRHYVEILNHGKIIGNVSDLYDCFDKSGQGYVTLDDVIAVAVANSAPTPRDALADAFQRVDRDSDGRISYRDFLATVNSGLAELGVL